MDTGSHLLFGTTLAGLSLLDPTVSAHPDLLYAVLAATLLGSHAPDFDAVMRLKGGSAYIRNHRGLTHTLPAPLVWAPVIGLPIAWLFGVMEWSWIVMLWAFIAVCFHITLDLFNAYGVQCMRPFTKRWLHLDVLPLFDPYMFGAHSAAVLLWITGAVPDPARMFLVIYALTLIYMQWRLLISRSVIRSLCTTYGAEQEQITLTPSLFGTTWQFVIDNGDSFIKGNMNRTVIHEEERLYKRNPERLAAAAEATIEVDGVQAFHNLAACIHVNVEEDPEGYLVTWSDVRFWHKKHFPFTAAVRLDRNLNVINERVGWNKKMWEPPFV
ncbi:inner membrane protein [Paenibacillus taihuensis]|uniref:Inner membrane protein n=1 Tax=Paenibacillus taihuensis TaxID=1156355 RepID=A0A3D9RTK2_9BACL|nr:metal-dependent hydrolase [Paenibacillus taihuensis]REE80052.1 inner membrane protein [Paenibacillus taihuensis]